MLKTLAHRAELTLCNTKSLRISYLGEIVPHFIRGETQCFSDEEIVEVDLRLRIMLTNRKYDRNRRPISTKAKELAVTKLRRKIHRLTVALEKLE